MDILYIVPYAPNLIRVRPYQLIRALARRGHRVTLASLWTSAQEKVELQQLAEAGVRVLAQPQPILRSLVNCLRTLPTSVPLQAVYSWQPALARLLLTTIQHEQFDVVHVEHLRGARYGLYIKDWCTHWQLSLPIVWDSVDCISHLFAQAAQHSRSRQGRLITQLELKRTRSYEGWLVSQFNQVLVTSVADQSALAELVQQYGKAMADGRDDIRYESNLQVLANGVDLDYFVPRDTCREPAMVVFSGKMSYHANVTAALYLVEEIMPIVWAQQPEVQVYIVGKDPTPEIRGLAARAGINSGKPRVVVTGAVADIRPYLHKATLAVAPILYGAGIQNKVLEAMACGAPVVASPQATTALATQAGCELLVAQDASSFAQAILALLADPAHRADLGHAGRAFVERYHSWNVMATQLETIYDQARRGYSK
ncbi:MAG: glycosyltransferase [Caldilineaceae bacterium]